VVAALGRWLVPAMGVVAGWHAVAAPIGWGQYALRSGVQAEGALSAPARLDDGFSAQSLLPLGEGRSGSGADGGSDPERWIEPPAMAVVDAGAYRVADLAPAAGAAGKPSQAGGGDIRLLPPSSERDNRGGGVSRGWLTLVSSGSSLLLVLGLFLAIAIGWRRSGGGATGSLPREVFQVLGSSTGGGRERLVLLRLGQRLVLVSQSGGHSQTLCQVDDPLEVDRLAGLCEQQRQGSLSDSFRQVLQGLPERSSAKRSGAGGWLGWVPRVAAGGGPLGGR
jgi:flagellar biogenesis protein FliO